MKTGIVIRLLLLFFAVGQQAVWGQDVSLFRTISGKVIDRESKERLAFVSVELAGTNVATITNTDGEFSLKIPLSDDKAEIEFSYIGYLSRKLPADFFKDRKRNIVELEHVSFSLPEVLVKQTEGLALMKEVIRRIPRNYSLIPNQMVGFYREMIRKNGSYISLAEAVLDIYKAPYHSVHPDMAKIYKGRRSTDKARLDTVLFKYQGGVTTALELDLAKNYDMLFSPDMENYYHFFCENTTMIDQRPHYVLVFRQRKEVKEPLFNGKFYIDAETMAISRVEFSLNIEDREKATAIFIRRKPAGMKIQVEEAHYLVQFRQQGDCWYYQNSRAEVSFKCRWPRRLFNSHYALVSEMAVTDRGEEGAVKFPRKQRVSSDDVIVEKVSDFEDVNFWESYNIIEPEQSIENAIKRLSRKLKKRH